MCSAGRAHELHFLGFPMHLELRMLPLRIGVSPDGDVWGRYYSARHPGSWLTITALALPGTQSYVGAIRILLWRLA